MQSIHGQKGSKTPLLQKWRLALDASKCREISKGDLAVLMAIVDRINKNSVTSFPGINRIAEDVGMDRTSVMRSIRKLDRMQYLSVKRGRPNRYSIGAKGRMDATYGVLGVGGAAAQRIVARAQLGKVAPIPPELKKKNLETEFEDVKASARKDNVVVPQTFSDWLLSLDGTPPIPDNHSLWFCTDVLGLGKNFIEHAWIEFDQQYERDSETTSEDWPSKFLGFVQNCAL